jgi:hypothetical protein
LFSIRMGLIFPQNLQQPAAVQQQHLSSSIVKTPSCVLLLLLLPSTNTQPFILPLFVSLFLSEISGWPQFIKFHFFSLSLSIWLPGKMRFFISRENKMVCCLVERRPSSYYVMKKLHGVGIGEDRQV